MKPERSLVSSKTWAFFWSVLFLIQENVCNRTQFESTLQLLQDFFAFRVKFSENNSVTTSKPVICLKIRYFFPSKALQSNPPHKNKESKRKRESYPLSFYAVILCIYGDVNPFNSKVNCLVPS